MANFIMYFLVIMHSWDDSHLIKRVFLNVLLDSYCSLMFIWEVSFNIHERARFLPFFYFCFSLSSFSVSVMLIF